MKRLRAYGPEFLILLGGAVFVLLGRGRWANVEADHGFWFSAAQSMVSGGRAMHEVRLQWGPMPLWILEGVGRVFGMRVASFVIFQLVVGVLAILGVQVFARRFLSLVERWTCAAILVTLIVWMVGSGNLLYPCAFAMSQALLLAVSVLILHARFVGLGTVYGSMATGILVGVTFLTKQEFGIAAVLGIGALTVFAATLDRRAKARVLAVSAVAFLATYFGVLLAVSGSEVFRHLVQSNLLWPWASVPGPWGNFYRKTLGLDDPVARLIEAANSLLYVVAFGGTVWFVLYFVDVPRRRRLALAAALIATWILWWWRWTEGAHFQLMTLALPAILVSTTLACLGWLRQPPLPAGEAGPHTADRVREVSGLPHPDPPPLPRLRRTGLPRGEGVGIGPLLALALGALVLLQRVGYRGNLDGSYAGMGYVLAVPVAAPLIWRAIRGPRNARWKSFAALAIFLVLAARLGLGRLEGLENEWRSSSALDTPRGTVYVTTNYAFLFSTYEFLKSNTAPGDSILIMPQTYGLDFLLDRRNLSFFTWVAPGYLTDEQELIARLNATPPKAVIIFADSFAILHSGTFGKGFANAVVRWIEAKLPRHSESGANSNEKRFLPAASGGI